MDGMGGGVNYEDIFIPMKSAWNENVPFKMHVVDISAPLFLHLWKISLSWAHSSLYTWLLYVSAFVFYSAVYTRAIMNYNEIQLNVQIIIFFKLSILNQYAKLLIVKDFVSNDFLKVLI